MPRITKAMLEEENRHLRERCDRYCDEIVHLKDKLRFITGHSQIHYLDSCITAHEKEVDALAHAITALTDIIKGRR